MTFQKQNYDYYNLMMMTMLMMNIHYHALNYYLVGSSKDEDVIQYIRQLQFAIHMGLNCLAIDIGSDPMLISTPISSSSILTSSTTRKLTTMTQDQVTKTPKLSNAAATATTTTRKRGVPTLAYLSIMDCYLLEDDSQVVKTDGSNDKMVSKIYYFMYCLNKTNKQSVSLLSFLTPHTSS